MKTKRITKIFIAILLAVILILGITFFTLQKIIDSKYGSIVGLIYAIDNCHIDKEQTYRLVETAEEYYPTLAKLKQNQLDGATTVEVLNLASELSKQISNEQMSGLLYFAVNRPEVKTSIFQKISLARNFYDAKKLKKLTSYRVLKLVETSSAVTAPSSAPTRKISQSESLTIVNYLLSAVNNILTNVPTDRLATSIDTIKLIMGNPKVIDKIPVLDIVESILCLKQCGTQLLNNTDTAQNFCLAVSGLCGGDYGYILRCLGGNSGLIPLTRNLLSSLTKEQIVTVFLEYDRQLKTHNASGTMVAICNLLTGAYKKLTPLQQALLPQQLDNLTVSHFIYLPYSGSQIISFCIDTAQFVNYPPDITQQNKLNSVWQLLI